MSRSASLRACPAEARLYMWWHIWLQTEPVVESCTTVLLLTGQLLAAVMTQDFGSLPLHVLPTCAGEEKLTRSHPCCPTVAGMRLCQGAHYVGRSWRRQLRRHAAADAQPCSGRQSCCPRCFHCAWCLLGTIARPRATKHTTSDAASAACWWHCARWRGRRRGSWWKEGGKAPNRPL